MPLYLDLLGEETQGLTDATTAGPSEHPPAGTWIGTGWPELVDAVTWGLGVLTWLPLSQSLSLDFFFLFLLEVRDCRLPRTQSESLEELTL